MVSVAEAEAVAGRGLDGDRYSKLDGGRQVTLIGAFLGMPVPPDLVRRNLVLEGLNLLSLKERRFRIGEALLRTSGECHPCSRMEEALGVGAYNAMRGQGGITAQVLEGGRIRLGDSVIRVDDGS